MCYLIFSGLSVSMEKRYEGIRASTFLKVLFGDKLHDEVDGVEVSKVTKLLL